MQTHGGVEHYRCHEGKDEALEEQVGTGVTKTTRNVVVTREAKIEAPKPPVFKRVHNAQEVENFVWHLENYSWHGKVRGYKAKINTICCTYLSCYDGDEKWLMLREVYALSACGISSFYILSFTRQDANFRI